jgi:hypothetical protein
MTTSAPQLPGHEGMDERREEEQPSPNGPATPIRAPHPSRTPEPREAPDPPTAPEPRGTPDPPPVPRRNGVPHPPPVPGPGGVPDPPLTAGASGGAGPRRRLQPVPAPQDVADPARAPEQVADPAQGPEEVADPARVPEAGVVVDLVERRRRQQRLRRAAARRNRFVVVRDAAEKDLWAARRRARASLPSPVAVTRDIALALLEVEAGCRSAAQLERIFSPRLWEVLEHRIGRRGGPLPSGRSLISVRSQEDQPGLADTVAVVRRGELVRPVALRLDACGGRWTVTELRWWRNETDTAATPGRDGGSSR